MGVVFSSSHLVSTAPSSSERGALTLFPCSSVGSSHGVSPLQCGLLSPQSHSKAAGAQLLCLQGKSAGKSQLWHVEHLLPLILHCPCLQSCFSRKAAALSPFIGHVIPEVVPQSLMGSALASDGSVLEPASVGSVRHRESFKHLLTEATPVTSPLLPITCPCKSSTELWQKKLISFISQETLK